MLTILRKLGIDSEKEDKKKKITLADISRTSSLPSFVCSKNKYSTEEDLMINYLQILLFIHC